MSYLDESLAPGERLIARFDLHWTRKWRLWVFILLIIPTFGIAILAAIYEWMRLRNIELGVTDHRVVHKTGIVGRETEELRLASIETIDLHQTAWGRILGFGNVVLTGRGESNMILEGVADPLGVKRSIESAYSGAVETKTPTS